MLIYQGSTYDFCDKVKKNRLSDVMAENFRDHYGHSPSQSEFDSWQNSLSRMRDVVELAGLNDCHVALEYEVPYNQSRLDCMLFGTGSNDTQNIALVELKQWSSVNARPEEGNFVETFVGGAVRVVPHPSQQVRGYHYYITQFVEEFDKQPSLSLFSCAYCHNYSRSDSQGLFDPIYNDLIRDFPLYVKEDTVAVANKLKELLEKGRGFEIFNRFMQSRITPSKKLLENIRGVIRNEQRYSLINEQLVAKNVIYGKIRRLQKRDIDKAVIIIKGGPGTGKSIIALNILADLAGKGRNVLYACKSKTFREGLKSMVGAGSDLLFTNLYNFVPSRVEENRLDVLLVDEAHRIEHTNNHRYTPKRDKTDIPQLDLLIRSAKTSVFFIDDHQAVRKGEIGSSVMIREAAEKHGAEVDVVELHSQFRCMGSNDYIRWLEGMLGISGEKELFRHTSDFDLRIYDDIDQMYSDLSEIEKQKPNSARLTAGFCWPWSDPVGDTLVKDVRIGDFAMPWETKGDAAVGEYPPWYKWAYKPKGFEQVGCIYTAQGFEFDYVGVIVGGDIYYDEGSDSLKADISKTCDPTLRNDAANFERYVKNIYRVLMTRGIKGCFVYFVSPVTRRNFERWME